MLKKDVRKTDVDFLNCNFEPGPPFRARWYEVVAKNTVQKCTLLNLSYHSRVHLMENWLCQFVQMGHAKQTTKPIFDWGGTVGGTRYKALIFRVQQRRC